MHRWLIALSLLLSAQVVSANHGGDGQPILAATHSLTLAAKELVQTAAVVGTTDRRLSFSANTLAQAADHFEQELRFSPQTLGADFTTLQRAFETLRAVALVSPDVQNSPQVQQAWRQVEGAHLAFRQAWAYFTAGGNNTPPVTGWHPGGSPGGYPPGGPPPNGTWHGVVCYARNIRGMRFRGIGWNELVARQEALGSCERESWRCSLELCQPF